jgi:hypothetical protein
VLKFLHPPSAPKFFPSCEKRGWQPRGAVHPHQGRAEYRRDGKQHAAVCRTKGVAGKPRLAASGPTTLATETQRNSC